MSIPNIDDINPNITLTRDEAINLLLASIALEELGLSHIINAEGEKIQAVTGTLTNIDIGSPDLSDLFAINKSVNKNLQTVINKEILLLLKYNDVIELILRPTVHSNIATVEGFYNGVAYTDSDIAYYNTGASPVNMLNT